MATEKTSPAELITMLVEGVDPAKLSLFAEDLQWLVANDSEKRSSVYWLGQILREGAKAQRRSVQYSLDTKRRKESEDKQKQNEEKFTKFLLNNPETAGDLHKLLVIAQAFEIPVNIVMEIHNKAVAAKAEHEKREAEKVAVKKSA